MRGRKREKGGVRGRKGLKEKGLKENEAKAINY